MYENWSLVTTYYNATTLLHIFRYKYFINHRLSLLYIVVAKSLKKYFQGLCFAFCVSKKIALIYRKIITEEKAVTTV